jgi:N-acetylmuramoyl-L-alanine amidase
LKYSGYDADFLVPEDYDVSLRARVERANTWCRLLGKRNVCLVSMHTNAAALSENLFHDNADDLAFLESAPGRQAIIDLHVRGIISYVKG